MNMKQQADGFFGFLTKTRNFSPHSLRIYKKSLDQFFGFSQTINFEDIKKYRAFLDQTNLDPRTKNLRLIPLRNFLRYLANNEIDCLNFSRIELYRLSHSKDSFPEISDIDIQKYLSFRKNPRTDFLVNLLHNSGLRIAEAVSLLVSKTPTTSITVIGKGTRPRTVFITELTVELWKKYLASRPVSKSQKLFPVCVRELQRNLVDRSNHLGLSVIITPHLLRHLFATNLVKNGAPIDYVQRLLGHASILTTQRYLHLPNNHLAENYKKWYSPINV